MSQKKSLYQAEFTAPKEPPPDRPAPVNTTGTLAWLRSNLFSSPVNSIATIVTGAVLIWLVSGSLIWFMRDAEWNVVTENLRLLMVGQYDPEEVWRVGLVSLVVLALSGMGLAFWSNMIRAFFGTAITTLLLLVMIPWGASFAEPPPIRMIAGPENIFGPLAFVVDEGQAIGVQVERIDNDEATGASPESNGFIETTAGASNSRIVWNDVKTAVTGDQLDLSQYDQTLTVRLLDSTGETIEEITSTPEETEVGFALAIPETGWYAVQVEAAADNTAGYAWVRVNGVLPFTTKPEDVEARLATYGEQPQYECPDTSECTTTVARRSLRFEGSRTMGQYFNVQLAPFVDEVFTPLIIALVTTVTAFMIGLGLKRTTDQTQKKLISRIMVVLWVLLIPFSWIMISGFEGSSVLPSVPTSVWGGLMLTVMLTVISVLASLPISVLLALGRRSNLPIVSLICTTFIEVVRGVPLITILFFAKLIVPFFSDALVNVDDVIRMLIGLTLFTAAYQAEVIRGGLQIVPKGQYEAAQALGLSGYHTLVFITLPQAIRAVIPAMMSQFVSLFKDTTLVSIVGLFELLGIVDFIVNGQQANRAFQREAFLFVGIIYFVLAYIMSQLSRRLEETGSGSVSQR